MKLLLGEIYSISPILNKAFNEVNFSASTKWKLLELIDPIDKALEHREKVRQNLVMTYGVDQGDGTIAVPNEKINEYMQEMIKLDSMEIELPDFNIMEDDLHKVDNFSARELKILKELINLSNGKTITNESEQTEAEEVSYQEIQQMSDTEQ